MITTNYEHGAGVYAQLIRHTATDKASLGQLLVFNEQKQLIFTCVTLEKPWLNNLRQVSCIPIGQYYCTKEINPKFGQAARVHDVPDRDGILFHKGNFYWNTRGCVLVGTHFEELNYDGEQDTVNSSAAMHDLYQALNNTFQLEVLRAQFRAV